MCRQGEQGEGVTGFSGPHVNSSLTSYVCLTASCCPPPSSQGHLNNYRVIAPTVTFSLRAPNAQNVFVLGDWDNWQVGGRTGVCGHLPCASRGTRRVYMGVRHCAGKDGMVAGRVCSWR